MKALIFIYLAFSVNIAFSFTDLEVQSFLKNYCTDCHNSKKQKGKVRLDNINELKLDAKLNILNQIEEQISLANMPPEDEDIPKDVEIIKFLDWISKQYVKHKSTSKFKEKMRFPSYGNYVDHEKLFSGDDKGKAFTPARRWLISSYIFNQRINEFYQMDERALGQTHARQHIKNPFVLPDHEAIHYYDNNKLNGGHLLTIMANAKWITRKELLGAAVKKGISELEKDYKGGTRYETEWVPETPKIFEQVIMHEGMPSDSILKNVIKFQFQKVLRRQPTANDLSEYLSYLKSNIKESDNFKGLEKMLLAVWMEEELYYRSEFGEGPVDESGRKVLAPVEAAYAIAYALGDAEPDEVLMKAAKSGKLKSRADFKREVLRLLGETSKEYPVDNLTHHGKYISPNPRILRFFRDFLAYPKARNIFKDNNRYGGLDYRHVAQTVVKDADMLVEYFIDQNKDVFENILASDHFYVYHDGDNVKTVEKVNRLHKNHLKSYELIKGKDWREDPKAFFTELGMHKEGKNKAHNKHRLNGLVLRMNAVEESVGRGNTPIPFRRQEILLRAPELYVYNIDHHNWNYVAVQPFSLSNRRGLLTHPAWLIAHSQNTVTDPVKRGKFIRERLLAGTVPDVPITVDAAIPEDPHNTIRTRLASVTEKAACWKCHKKMNPLGYPFEAYDDFGRYRINEQLEHPDNITVKGSIKPNIPNKYKTLPVDAKGYLKGTGDKSLDGEVKTAVDLMARLGKSTRVRQSIIRHAFRYFMGRNEMLSDSQALIDADKAYLESGGSFKAVVVSLLTSDSFIYRK